MVGRYNDIARKQQATAANHCATVFRYRAPFHAGHPVPRHDTRTYMRVQPKGLVSAAWWERGCTKSIEVRQSVTHPSGKLGYPTTHELYRFTKAMLGGSNATARATKLADGSSPQRVTDFNKPSAAQPAGLDSRLSSTVRHKDQECNVRLSVLRTACEIALITM